MMSAKMEFCLYSPVLALKGRNMEQIFLWALKVRKAEGVKGKIPTEKKSFRKGISKILAE